MSSLKDARDLALISYSESLITDEELLLLLEENKSRNPEFSYDVYNHFDLENMEEAKPFGLPESFTCPQRSVAKGIEVLCIHNDIHSMHELVLETSC